MSHLNTCIDRGTAWGRAGSPACWGPACAVPCHGGMLLPGLTQAGLGSPRWEGTTETGLLPGLPFAWMEPGSNLAATERRGGMVWGGRRWVPA